MMQLPHEAITEFIFLEDEPRKADLILVPGGSSRELMDKACDLFLAGYAPYIMPSGGENELLPGYESEWHWFLEIARERGVPADRVLKEDKAGHTFANARLSREVIDRAGMTVRTAILVCKAFHSRRALFTYQTEFGAEVEYIVVPIIDRRGISKDNWYLDADRTAKVMNEIEKIGKYFGPHMEKLAKRGAAHGTDKA